MGKAAGLTVVLVASATAACGLMMLAGVGPTAASVEIGDSVPGIDAAAAFADPYATSSTTAPPTTVEITATTTSSTSTTTTSTTTTSTTSTTTTMPPEPVSPVPLSVSPSAITVGAGGTARISGTCPMSGGTALGPVEIWQIGTGITVIETNLRAAQWSYDWTAPSVVEPLVLQPWCGSPGDYTGGFPASLQIAVVFVGQQAPPASPPPPSTTPAPGAAGDDGSGGPGSAIPETD